MIGILGKKLGMTQIFETNGNAIGATVIQAGPCSLLQIKTKQSDGYNAIALGFDNAKESRIKKPLREKFKKINVAVKKLVKEFRVENPQDYKLGQDITIAELIPGNFVNVIGVSKGKGFQGGMKRWNWSGGPQTHGSMSHRAPGSIGASAFPSRVIKGHRLPGHMGNQRITVKGLEVITVDKDNHIIVVKGAVPGPKNSYLIIKKSGKKKTKVVEQKKTSKEEAQPKQTKKGTPAKK